MSEASAERRERYARAMYEWPRGGTTRRWEYAAGDLRGVYFEKAEAAMAVADDEMRAMTDAAADAQQKVIDMGGDIDALRAESEQRRVEYVSAVRDKWAEYDRAQGLLEENTRLSDELEGFAKGAVPAATYEEARMGWQDELNAAKALREENGRMLSEMERVDRELTEAQRERDHLDIRLQETKCELQASRKARSDLHTKLARRDAELGEAQESAEDWEGRYRSSVETYGDVRAEEARLRAELGRVYAGADAVRAERDELRRKLFGLRVEHAIMRTTIAGLAHAYPQEGATP